MESEGVSAVTCNICGMFVFLPEPMATYTCTKCKLITLLEEKVQQLEAQLSTLRNIRELEMFLDKAQDQVQDKEFIVNEGLGNVDGLQSEVQEEDTWKYVTHRSREIRKNSVGLELHNRFEVLSVQEDNEEQIQDQEEWIVLDECMGDGAEEEVSSQMRGVDKARNVIPRRTREQQQQSSQIVPVMLQDSAHASALVSPQKRRVLVVGDSILRGTETEICKPDKLTREVCCLPGAKIQDVTERLTKLIRPTDHYPFLLVHVGTNDTAKHSLQKIKSDFEALGRKLKNFNAQIVFSSLLPVVRHSPGRERKIAEVNNWLRRWCRQEHFGFLDHGLRFLEDGLLRRDGLHLTAIGKRIFAKRLANLIRRALN